MKDKIGDNRIAKIIILSVIGILFYLMIYGDEWICMEKDSYSYINPTGRVGVMLGYPLFLFLHKLIAGEYYLNLVIITQAALAIICTMVFTMYLENTFQLRFWETIFIYLLCMLPFSIYLPQSNITHQILTEGITYALFYIYFVCCLEYLDKKRKKNLATVIVITMLLSMIRSQLLFLYIVTLGLFVYAEWKKEEKKKFFKAVVSFVLGSICMVASIFCVYKIQNIFANNVVPLIMAEKENSDGIIGKEEQTQEESFSQFLHVVMIRGFLEMEEEDENLFETEEKQELFRRIYQVLDEEKCLSSYVEEGLYMWKDLFKGDIVSVAGKEINTFLEENPDTSFTKSSIVFEFGLKIIFKHFGRFIYHTCRILLVGFMASVFFQIDKIYLLCHIITIFLFLFAFSILFIMYKKKIDERAVALLGFTLFYLVIMVGVISIVFFTLQRYMVYAMGIFYISIYICLRQMWIKREQLRRWNENKGNFNQ